MGEDKNKNILIKIGCVVAAFVMWIYTSNESNAKHTRTIKDIPVQIINSESLNDSGLVLSTNYDYTISLKVSGTTSAVYAVSPEQFQVVADLDGYILNEGLKKIPVDILKSPKNINVINDTTLWVEIKLDKLVTKTIPVKIRTKGSVPTEYYQYEPIIEPSSVIVTGSEEYVDKIANIYAELDVKGVTGDLSQNLPVVAYDSVDKIIKGLTINPSTVNVSVPIKEIKSVGVDISTKGTLTSGLILNSITPEVNKIKITGNDEKIKSINSIQVEAIDLSKLTEKNNKLKVKLIIPEGIKAVGYDEYIEISIKLDKVIEKNLNINIENRNLGNDLKANYTAESVSLIISGAETILANINNESIKCYLDFSELNEGVYDIPLKFEIPNNINIISQNIRIVKATLENVGSEEEIVNSEDLGNTTETESTNTQN